jgi:23S rRNA (adenine2030-N6)-methyltransferase
MNYRHAYHAGNFADVFKHSVFALVIEYFKLKPKPFRVIDTHAGIGLYDLQSIEAGKTGEWQSGIARLLEGEPPSDIAPLLAPYLNVIKNLRDQHGAYSYPGSPVLARSLIRPGDVLIANELHPDDVEQLRLCFAGDPQTKVLNQDGWSVLKATLPPKERRAVVLIDPPFEQAGEFDRMYQAVLDAQDRFEAGTLLLWYPIKQRAPVESFNQSIADLGVGKALTANVMISAANVADQLNGTGLTIINPPYGLFEKVQNLLPYLAHLLSRAATGSGDVKWLGKDTPT